MSIRPCPLTDARHSSITLIRRCHYPTTTTSTDFNPLVYYSSFFTFQQQPTRPSYAFHPTWPNCPVRPRSPRHPTTILSISLIAACSRPPCHYYAHIIHVAHATPDVHDTSICPIVQMLPSASRPSAYASEFFPGFHEGGRYCSMPSPTCSLLMVA